MRLRYKGLILLVILLCGVLFLGAKEVIHLDIHSVEVQAESLPLDFPGLPDFYTTELQAPSIEEVECDVPTGICNEFLADFVKKEWEDYNKSNAKQSSK